MNMNNPEETDHIFYDGETTGPDTKYDQMLQVAAIRADADLMEVDSIDVRSRLLPYMVPTAMALKVTHVDPYDIARARYAPFDFAKHLHDTFSTWSAGHQTSFSGFNTINYDEELLRQTFFQNLLDPYLTSGANKTRNDYLIMLRALHARNPDCIDIPVDPVTGKKSFRLEKIAPQNGFRDHNAHDALGDVRATLFLARLIRDTDPHLFAHMLAMGNSRRALSFIEANTVFKLLGGPMLNPGILDACLLASDPKNNKAMVAWNLGVDPTPYLDLPPEQILEKMRQTGTPFRTVKANKQPGVFPMNWGFLHPVVGEDWEPATPAQIDARTRLILDNPQFAHNTREALILKARDYSENVHLEEKIYSGFASYKDKDRMRAFHNSSSWLEKIDIARSFEKPELKSIGLRLAYAHEPEVLGEKMLPLYDERIANERLTLDTDRPWNTVGKLMEELDQLDIEMPDDPELANIRAWALETYPVAAEWEGWKKSRENAPVKIVSSSPDEVEDRIEDDEEVAPAAPAQKTAKKSRITYLDGIS